MASTAQATAPRPTIDEMDEPVQATVEAAEEADRNTVDPKVMAYRFWETKLGSGSPEYAHKYEDMAITDMVRMIGGAIVMIALIAVILNEVLTVGAIANSSGPFSGIITDLETTGVAAIGLLIVGLLVAAGAAIMRIMDRGF